MKVFKTEMIVDETVVCGATHIYQVPFFKFRLLARMLMFIFAGW